MMVFDYRLQYDTLFKLQWSLCPYFNGQIKASM